MHFICGGGTADDGGGCVPGSNNSGDHGAIQQANADVNVKANQGSHTHSVQITRANIVQSIASATGVVDDGTLTPDAISGEGVNHGLKSPADGHNHNTSGSLPITNRSHTHTISDITPPWYAITMIIKL